MSTSADHKIEPGGITPVDPAQVLKSLKSALIEERAAIETLDQEKLREVGDKISDLLSHLSLLIPSIEINPHDKVKEASTLLREARLLRDENSRLLNQKFCSIGSAVKKNSLHLRAVKAYYKEDNRSELFLKKNC